MKLFSEITKYLPLYNFRGYIHGWS